MPGISFIDENTSYEFAKFVDWLIKLGWPVFSLFTVGILYADWKAWKPKHVWSKAIKWTVHFFVFGLALFCIIYNNDGRYTETEVGDHGNTSYYYFGKAKNGVRFGFGKLFDSDKKIYMIADAKGNKIYEDCKKFSRDGDSAYLSFEGTLVDGKREGFGKQYTLVNGISKLSYEGSYHKGARCGEGIEYRYYSSGDIKWKYVGEQLNDKFNAYGTRWMFDENGNLKRYYTGGFAEDKYSGYGVELIFQDQKVVHAYYGTYWNGKKWGKGTREYINNNGILTIWTGYSYDEEQQDDGAYYNADGEFWATEDNGSLIKNDEGETVRDEERIAELINKWPAPDELMYGKSAEDFLID